MLLGPQNCMDISSLIFNPFLKWKGTQHTLLWWLWNLTDCLVLSQWHKVSSFLLMSNLQQQWVKIARKSMISNPFQREDLTSHYSIQRYFRVVGEGGRLKRRKPHWIPYIVTVCQTVTIYHACNFYFMRIREGRHIIFHIIKENSSSIMICTGSKVTTDGKI